MPSGESLSPQARDAARLLGSLIAAGRRRRRWTAARLAEQANISPVTLRKVERGDPGVALGTVLEVAVLVGVPLFGEDDPSRLADRTLLAESRLALLPARVLPITNEGLDDDF